MTLLLCQRCGKEFKRTNYNSNRPHAGKYCSMECRRGATVSTVTRILKRLVIDPEKGCHLWTGSTTGRGYGNTGSGYVHRIIWESKFGPVPEGLQLDHLCGVKTCCNTDHLRGCTAQVNILASNNMAARHAKKLVCPKCAGPYTTFQRKRGEFRVCMPCKKKHDAEYHKLHPVDKERQRDAQRRYRQRMRERTDREAPSNVLTRSEP